MPDLSPHKAHTGIQICQAQPVRGWDYVVYIKSDRAGATQYLIFNLLNISKLLFLYWLSVQLLVSLQPCRQTKQRNPRTPLSCRECKGISSWGSLVNSYSDTFVSPELLSPVTSSARSGLFKEEGGLHFNPLSYKIVVRQPIFWTVVRYHWLCCISCLCILNTWSETRVT